MARSLAAASAVAVSNGTLKPSFSFGVAEFTKKEKVGALIARCDEALVSAKEEGRSRGCRHDGEICAPIDVSADESAESDTDGDLDSCFAELRERLKEVTTEG